MRHRPGRAGTARHPVGPSIFRSAALIGPLLALLLASFPVSAQDAPLGDEPAQLVYMTNGRTLRAESVEEDGRWLLLTLEGGNVLGVLNRTVDHIEDDLIANPGELGDTLNVVTSGRYIPPSSRGRGRSALASPRRPQPPRQQDTEEKEENRVGAAQPQNQPAAVQAPAAGRVNTLRQAGSLRRNVRGNSRKAGDQ